jgi:hypothetical protein
VRPVLALPLWLGTLRDASGCGCHGTNTSGHWVRQEHQDGFIEGEINIGANPVLQPDNITIFVWGNLRSQTSNEYIVTTSDFSTRFYLTSTQMRFATNGVNSARAITAVPSKSLAVTATSTSAAPQFYVDGALDGVGALNVSVSIGALAWIVAGLTGSEMLSPVSGLLVFPDALTAAEIAALHTWSQSRYTPHKQWPGGGLDIPTLAGTSANPRFIDNIQTARVSLANETSGQLSNTGAQINSGTWKLSEDADGRYYDCVVNGQLEHPLIGASGFDTEAFVATGTATLTKNANNIQIDALAGERITRIVLTDP